MLQKKGTSSGSENGVVGGKNGVLFAQSTPTFLLKKIKIWGVMGVILIIIYCIYNNLIYVGGVAHFLCGKCGKCGKCILPHFVAIWKNGLGMLCHSPASLVEGGGGKGAGGGHGIQPHDAFISQK